MGIYELIILLIVFAPGLIAMMDILKSEFKGNDKIVWLLAVLIVPYIGAIAYFFIGRKQKIKEGSR